MGIADALGTVAVVECVAATLVVLHTVSGLVDSFRRWVTDCAEPGSGAAGVGASALVVVAALLSVVSWWAATGDARWAWGTFGSLVVLFAGIFGEPPLHRRIARSKRH
ncbi:hypothetical protein [Curtobacterium sp. UCD-KPL2560]|uniref:hypothetical protein n=1 Tax=Curtobacterium sp. UCD-KPL2560 TaxID=1885315 RepID=UPI00114D3431|nr:hypothetical protein [Curtobacterium sp. UCD-KPL2560]